MDNKKDKKEKKIYILDGEEYEIPKRNIQDI